MLQVMAGYPGFDTISPSVMSLRTVGVVRTPAIYVNDGLITQKNYEQAGFQGLGEFDPTSLLAGGSGTLMLVGIAVGLYYLMKAMSPEAEKKRARAKYNKDIAKVNKKYAEYGFGGKRREVMI